METASSFYSKSIGYFFNCVTVDGRVRRLSISSTPLYDIESNVVTRSVEDYLETGGPDILSIPIDPVGTDFQKDVWGALRKIPRGEVRTYSQIAHDIGRPGAARAVGNAVASNHLLILVPCHRVVASRSLGGFSTEGGVETKKRILALEGYIAKGSGSH